MSASRAEGGAEGSVEVVEGPKVIPGKVGSTIDVKLRLCEHQPSAVTLHWERVGGSEEGVVGPVELDADGCVAVSVDVPAMESTYRFVLHSGRDTSGKPLWEARSYLGLAGEEPTFVPRLK